jgi:hypothetical protein
MFSGNANAKRKAAQAFADLLRFHKSPLDVVPDEILLEWADADPTARYPLIAASATLFRRPKKDEPHEWTPLTSKLLAKTPEPARVFKEIVQRLQPTSWSGSYATKLESRLQLLERLPIGDSTGLQQALYKSRRQLEEEIARQRKREADEDKNSNRRFE